MKNEFYIKLLDSTWGMKIEVRVKRSRFSLLALSLSKGHSILVGQRSEISNLLKEDVERVAGDQLF
jgi:hypothetical protein